MRPFVTKPCNTLEGTLKGSEVRGGGGSKFRMFLVGGEGPHCGDDAASADHALKYSSIGA